MGKINGFLEYDRKTSERRDKTERLKDYNEVYEKFSSRDLKTQAARCMDCGLPLCHNHLRGCPISNIIPEWNHLVYSNRWEEAANRLGRTNNFPDITGRICPALCEDECVLGINKPSVTIREIERKISDRAWDEERYKPQIPLKLTGKKIAVVGSGPAGLACAQQLSRAGHQVTVYEKAPKSGGLVRYGVPNFKLDKSVIDRNIALMEQEGTLFVNALNIGFDKSYSELKENNDALVLANGCEIPRDLSVDGRDLQGIHFAMEFLSQQILTMDGVKIPAKDRISAKGKNVLVIGGGDTGSDCVGTSLRQGAKNVYSFEVFPEPDKPKFSTSHEEGGERIWQTETLAFEGEDGKVKKVNARKLKFNKPYIKNGQLNCKPVDGSEFSLDIDLVLLAVGFSHPNSEKIVEQLGCELTQRKNIKIDDNKMTSVDGVFAAGDVERGQSLVVWAIREGRAAAKEVDKYLMGSTRLP